MSVPDVRAPGPEFSDGGNGLFADFTRQVVAAYATGESNEAYVSLDLEHGNISELLQWLTDNHVFPGLHSLGEPQLAFVYEDSAEPGNECDKMATTSLMLPKTPKTLHLRAIAGGLTPWLSFDLAYLRRIGPSSYLIFTQEFGIRPNAPFSMEAIWQTTCVSATSAGQKQVLYNLRQAYLTPEGVELFCAVAKESLGMV